jgi:hypothetical protein
MEPICTKVIAVGLLAAGLALGTVAIAASDETAREVELTVQAPLRLVRACLEAASTR